MRFKDGDKVVIDLNKRGFYIPHPIEFKKRMELDDCIYLIIKHAGFSTCDLYSPTNTYIGAALFTALKPYVLPNQTFEEYVQQMGGVING